VSAKKTLQENSKGRNLSDCGPGRYRLDEVKVGALLRQAEALEKMAADVAEIARHLKWDEARRTLERKAIARMERKIATQKKLNDERWDRRHET
jgi:hypothetical protein